MIKHTTLNLPDEVWRTAKSAAALEGITVSLFVTQAIQTAVDKQAKPKK